jgi:hypothetical protein
VLSTALIRCNKCCKRQGEVCFEGCCRLTRSRRYSDISDREALPENSGMLKDSRHSTESVDFDALEADEDDQRTCLDYSVVPRWLAVVIAIVFAIGVIVSADCNSTLVNSKLYKLYS